MVVTIPLGRGMRYSIGRSTRGGWLTVRWRKPREIDFPLPEDDGDGPSGVREPRRPSPSSQGGAATLSDPRDTGGA